MTEIYLDTARYDFEVAQITAVLRSHQPDLEHRRDTIHVALRLAGIPMGELIIADGRNRPELRADLVEALATMEPDAFTGEFEDDQVRFVLGEEGNVWPASIRNEAA